MLFVCTFWAGNQCRIPGNCQAFTVTIFSVSLLIATLIGMVLVIVGVLLCVMDKV